MNRDWTIGLVGWIAAAMLFSACVPSATQATPDINATVQAAIEQTRAVEVAVATALAATSTAQAASTPTPTTGATTALTRVPTPTDDRIVIDESPAATPTAAPTNTPPPTPTEERLVLAETAVDGSDGDGREILISSSPTNGGRVVFLPGFSQSQVRTPLVFDNYVTGRVAVFDTRRSGQQDGNGIRSVTFEVFTPTGDSYSRREESAPFCLFGGDDPACPGIDVRRVRADWPDGQYSATITIEATDGLISSWFWAFCVNRCEVAGPPTIEWVQIGRDSLDREVRGELVFQVWAYQEAVGSDDGDGIDYVDFYIYGPDSQQNQAWYKREQDAAYCAFGGDAPCPGAAVNDPGRYWLVAVAVDEDGQQTQVEAEIEVLPNGSTVPSP